MTLLALVVQETQRLPSVLALRAHPLLRAAHQDPEVQQNQQPQLGHFHHENQDCHGSQGGQLNLEDQVLPFLQQDQQDLEGPRDREDPLPHRFQLCLLHLSPLCHLYHPWGLEFLQCPSLPACPGDQGVLCLLPSLLDQDCPLGHQDRGLQPCLSLRGAL